MEYETDSITIYKVDDKKRFQLLGQGNTAEIYQYEENKVLKLFRENMPKITIDNEYRVTCVVSKQLKNVPRVYGMVEYQNRYGIIYEQIIEKDKRKLHISHLLHIKRYSKLFASVHQSIHVNDVDVHLSVKEKLSRDIEAECDLSSKEKELIQQYLKKLPDNNKLCHFDFHPGNIMYQSNGSVIIDWMTACTGDPNADAARTLLLMRMGELIHINPFRRRLLHMVMKKIGTEYFKEYKKLTGSSTNDILQWILPVAAARLTEWMTDNERKKLTALVRKELEHMES